MNLLLTTDAVGGIWRYAVELSHGLAKRGHTITLAIVGPHASSAQTAELHPRVRPVQTNLPLDWLADSPTDLDHASTTLAGIDADIALLHAPALLRHRWPIPVAIMAHSCLATWFEAVRGGPVPPTTPGAPKPPPPASTAPTPSPPPPKRSPPPSAASTGCRT